MIAERSSVSNRKTVCPKGTESAPFFLIPSSRLRRMRTCEKRNRQMLLINPDDPPDEDRRQYGSRADAVKLRMICQTEKSGDDDQRNVKDILDF